MDELRLRQELVQALAGIAAENHHLIRPGYCKGMNRRTGEPCKNPAKKGLDCCGLHKAQDRKYQAKYPEPRKAPAPAPAVGPDGFTPAERKRWLTIQARLSREELGLVDLAWRAVSHFDPLGPVTEAWFDDGEAGLSLAEGFWEQPSEPARRWNLAVLVGLCFVPGPATQEERHQLARQWAAAALASLAVTRL